MIYPANKGTRCRVWQRVSRGRGRGPRLLRCKRFRHKGTPTGLKPANWGKTCKKMKLIFSPWLNKKVYRCASYGPGKPRVRANGNGRAAMPAAPAYAPLPPREMRPSEPPGPPDDNGNGYYIPMSLPSFEKRFAGRTPVQLTIPGTARKRRTRRPKQQSFAFDGTAYL